MLLYHIIVVAIDLKCPSILGIHVNFRGVPYHSGGFSANANITQPDLGQQSICDRVSVSTYAWHWESSHFSDLHPVGNQEQPEGARNIPVILTVDGSIHIGWTDQVHPNALLVIHLCLAQSPLIVAASYPW